MRRRIVLAVALLVAGGCESAPTYKQPPDNTYARATYQLKLGEQVTQEQGAIVAPEFFKAAGALPMLGRLFLPAEYTPSGTPVAVLSYDLWTKHFGSQPDAIGRVIELNGRQVTIVAIMPDGFQIPEGALLWTPRGGG